MNKALLLKTGVILLITVVLLIAVSQISSVIAERKSYQTLAKQSIANSWTGKQSVIGPIISLPYTIEWQEKRWSKDRKEMIPKTHFRRGVKYIIPESLHVDSVIDSDELYQGIYGVPVYAINMTFSGRYNISSLYSHNDIQLPSPDAKVTFEAPFLSLAVSDARGLNSVPTLQLGSQSLTFEAGSRLPFKEQGIHVFIGEAVKASSSRATVDFDVTLNLRGMEKIKFHPVALQYEQTIKSNWPHPKFTGDFLPLDRSISETGFEAAWKVSAFASNIQEQVKMCVSGQCQNLLSNDIGLELIDPVDVYLQSERSVKYALLFIGLVFIAFFVFEIIKSIPIHPVQYSLVGAAIAMFYLLLMSLSEHISFAMAYGISAVACSLLISLYLVYVLKTLRTAAVFCAMLTSVYGALFVIVGAEDYALVMGSVLVFAVLAVTMITTRNINWYDVGEQVKQSSREQVAAKVPNVEEGVSNNNNR